MWIENVYLPKFHKQFLWSVASSDRAKALDVCRCTSQKQCAWAEWERCAAVIHADMLNVFVVIPARMKSSQSSLPPHTLDNQELHSATLQGSTMTHKKEW